MWKTGCHPSDIQKRNDQMNSATTFYEILCNLTKIWSWVTQNEQTGNGYIAEEYKLWSQKYWKKGARHEYIKYIIYNLYIIYLSEQIKRMGKWWTIVSNYL